MHTIWTAQMLSFSAPAYTTVESVFASPVPQEPSQSTRRPLRTMVERHYLEALLRTLYTTKKSS